MGEMLFLMIVLLVVLGLLWVAIDLTFERRRLHKQHHKRMLAVRRD